MRRRSDDPLRARVRHIELVRLAADRAGLQVAALVAANRLDLAGIAGRYAHSSSALAWLAINEARAMLAVITALSLLALPLVVRQTARKG